MNEPGVAVVDYGLGNLYSVKHACAYAGLNATITSSKAELQAADGVILPGIGAFGDAMQNLNKLDLVPVLQDLAASGKPIFGVCLGLQLLMSESHEFGIHAGLNLIPGSVVRFQAPVERFQGGDRTLKVPQVGWNGICRARRTWDETPLAGLNDGDNMYFVHSFYVQPVDPTVVLSTSTYGNIEFCSSIHHANIFACQFHPERSGSQGLKIYQNFARILAAQKVQ